MIDTTNPAHVTGEWSLQPIGSTNDIGPQSGNDSLAGGKASDSTWWLNLQPRFVDNNIFLVGSFEPDMFSGKWMWSTVGGVAGEGSFESVRP